MSVLERATLVALTAMAWACSEPPTTLPALDASTRYRPCLREVSRYLGDETLVFDLAWSPAGTQLMTGSSNLLRLYSVDGDGEVSLQDTITSPTRFNSIQWSLDGRHALAPSGKFLSLFSVSSAGELEEVLQGPEHESELQRVALSPDGTRVLSCDVAGTTHLYDIGFSPPSLIRRDSVPVHERCTRVAWSPTGNLGLSAGRGGALALYKIEGSDLALTDRHWAQEETGEAIFGRDDTEAIGGSFGSLNTLWYFRVDPVSGTLSLLQSLEFHESGVGSLEWSHDGEYLLTSAHDHSTHLLERDGSGTGLLRVSDEDDDGSGVHSARWSPDDRYIAQTASNQDLLTIHALVPCSADPG